LSGEDFLGCIECVNAVRAHPAAAKLLDGGEREGSMFWKDGQFNVPCKARFDAMNRGGLIDLKTTVNAAPEEWGKQAANLLYHLQAAHYMNGAEAALNATPEFFAFVCVESDAPYAVACYVLPGAAISAGRVLCNIALERYAQALQAGVWPGYSPTIDVVPFPKWALRF